MTYAGIILGAAAVFIAIPAIVRLVSGRGKALDIAAVLGAAALLAWLLGYLP